MHKIFLIVGAPGTGKSTVAKALAKKLGIDSVIGTDTIREILRAAISKETCPTLHTSAILACDMAPPGADKNIWGFIRQAEDVKPGIEAVIKRHLKENTSLVMEGIHLVPGIIENTNPESVIKIVLTADEATHKTRLLGQGSDRSSYKLANFERARHFEKYLISQAKTSGCTVIHHDNLENTLTAIIKSSGI